MVVKVADKEISTKERGSGQVVSLPYGMVVWSTGIGPRAEIMDFMKQIGQVCFASKPIQVLLHNNFPVFTIWDCLVCSKQNNRRALATDEWLRVEGCENVYALGDCATINQRKVMV